MLSDVVIDTNVWAHADNPNEGRQADALDFVTALLNATTSLCVDEGFSLIESDNRSKVGNEYLTHLVALPIASAALATLAGSGRLAFLDVRVPDAVHQMINRLVHDPTDRIFVKLAFRTPRRACCALMTSRTFHPLRAKLKRVSVTVFSAKEAAEQLALR
jgi:hypothetical protein